MITQENLTELLEYNPNTGGFTWLKRPNEYARFIHAGDKAGGPNSAGYIHIRVFGRKYKAHRLAFLYMTGEFPAGEVDHINGIKGDNRWQNLRDITRRGNKENIKRPYSTNRLGLLGVTEHKGKYRAQICIAGVRKALGTYTTPEAAHNAYIAAKREHHAGNTL